MHGQNLKQFSWDSATELLRKFARKFLALNEIIPKASVEERPTHTKVRKHENNTLGAFAWLPLVLASPLLKE